MIQKDPKTRREWTPPKSYKWKKSGHTLRCRNGDLSFSKSINFCKLLLLLFLHKIVSCTVEQSTWELHPENVTELLRWIVSKQDSSMYVSSTLKKKKQKSRRKKTLILFLYKRVNYIELWTGMTHIATLPKLVDCSTFFWFLWPSPKWSPLFSFT